MNLISQADFARLQNVSRKTVTTWKKRGYIELLDGLVNVEASLSKLAGSGRSVATAVTGAASSVTGNDINARNAALYHAAGPHRDWANSVACMIDVHLLAELMLRHLPREVVEPTIAEYAVRSANAAAQMLEEDGVAPPAGSMSWSDHPWFNPELTEAEWSEREAEAKAHMAGADA